VSRLRVVALSAWNERVGARRAAFLRGRWVAGGLWLALAFATSSVQAENPAVLPSLPVRNYQPVQLVFPAPALDGVSLVPPGAWVFGTAFVESNTMNRSRGEAGTSSLLIDLETTRFELSARTGLSRRWELGLTLSFLRRWGGFLDAPIESVERVVGQLNPAREARARNEVRLRYERLGAPVFDLEKTSKSGLGDATVDLRFAAWRSSDDLTRLVLRFGAELPTGNEDALFGNGGIDLFAGIEAERCSGAWAWRGQLSFIFPDDFLPEAGLESSPFATASAGLAWQMNSRIAWIGQLDYYGSALSATFTRELESGLWELAAGISLRLGPALELQIGGVENLVVEPGADFSLITRLVYTTHGRVFRSAPLHRR